MFLLKVQRSKYTNTYGISVGSMPRPKIGFIFDYFNYVHHKWLVKNKSTQIKSELMFLSIRDFYIVPFLPFCFVKGYRVN